MPFVYEGMSLLKAHLLKAGRTFEIASASFTPAVRQLARLGQSLLQALVAEETHRTLTPVQQREPLSAVFKVIIVKVALSVLTSSPCSTQRVSETVTASPRAPGTAALPLGQAEQVPDDDFWNTLVSLGLMTRDQVDQSSNWGYISQLPWPDSYMNNDFQADSFTAGG